MSKISDNRLLDSLLKKENISFIEEILGAEGRDLEGLLRLKKERKLDLGPKIGIKKIKHHFPEVKAEVDNFLNISEACEPEFKMYGFLETIKKDMAIGYLASTSLLLFGGYALTTDTKLNLSDSFS